MVRGIYGKVPGMPAGVQYAQIMIKQDAVAAGQSVRAVQLLTQKLSSHSSIEGLQLLGVKIFFPTPEFAKRFYGHLPKSVLDELTVRLTCSSTHRGETEAPMIAILLRAQMKQPEVSLYEILRADSLIGPTFPEKAIAEGKVKEKQPTEDSIRDRLKQEVEGSYHLPDDLKPVYNGIHCSDGPQAALGDIRNLYSRAELPYIDKNELAALLPEGSSPVAMTGIPILETIRAVCGNFTMSGLEEIGRKRITSRYTAQYNPRHFGPKEAAQLLYDWGVYVNQERSYFSGIGDDFQLTGSSTAGEFKLITITGAPGSGKTTCLKRLKDKYAIIPIYTDRECAGGEGEVGIGSQDFDGRLNAGHFFAIEKLDGIRYGILREDIRSASDREGVHLLVCGPEIAFKLRRVIARVHCLLLWADGVELAERLKKREEESGRSAEKRMPAVLASYQFLEAKKGEFDRVIDNSVLGAEATAQEISAIIETFSPSARQNGASEISIRPQRARDLLGRICACTLDPALDVSTHDSIVASLLAQQGPGSIINLLKLFTQEASRLNSGRNPRTPIEVESFVSFLPVMHLLPAMAVAIQAAITPSNFSTKSGGLGTLSLPADQRREAYNLKRIRELAAAIPADERIGTALWHDWGKPQHVRDLPYHDLKGFQSIIDNQLLREFPFKPIILDESIEPESVKEITAFIIKERKFFENKKIKLFSTISFEDFWQILIKPNSLEGQSFATEEPSNLREMKKIFSDKKFRKIIFGKENSIDQAAEQKARALYDRMVYLRTMAKPEKTREIAEIVVKYHHIIGEIYMGATSMLSFTRVFNDAKVQKVLCGKDGKVNQFLAKAFLDRLLFITIADLGSRGVLSNLRVETYFWVRDKIMKIIEESMGDVAEIEKWIIALEETNTPTYRRLSAIASVLDKDPARGEMMDYRYYSNKQEELLNENIFYYLENIVKESINDSMSTKISNNPITNNEWNNLVLNFRRVNMLYAPALCELAVCGTPNRMSFESIKFMVILANLLANIPNELLASRPEGLKKDLFLNVIITDENGRLIFGKKNKEGLARLKEILNDSGTVFQIDGQGKGTLEGSNDALKVELKMGNGMVTATIKIAGIDVTKS